MAARSFFFFWPQRAALVSSSTTCYACLLQARASHAVRVRAARHVSNGAVPPNAQDEEKPRNEPDTHSSTSSSDSVSEAPPTTSPKSPTIPIDRALVKARIQQLRSQAMQAWSKQQVELSKRLSDAGNTINQVTGYGNIDRLKNEVRIKENELLEARVAARDAKAAHSNALAERMSSSREVNDLLSRKSSWLASDVARFTTLVQEDHVNEQRERDTKLDAQREEEQVEKKIDELMKTILERYHEEQIWSDKIRSMSTYGSLAITSLNVLLFLLALVLVEPYKRKRIVSAVESRMREREEKRQSELGDQLDDLKSLVLAGSGNLATWRAEIPAIPENGTQSSPADQAASSEDNAEDIATVDVQNESKAAVATPVASRDSAYAAVAGGLAGAAVVSALQAIFGFY